MLRRSKECHPILLPHPSTLLTPAPPNAVISTLAFDACFFCLRLAFWVGPIVAMPRKQSPPEHHNKRRNVDDLYDYAHPRPLRALPKRKVDEKKIVVTDDWPEFVPITEAELRVFEAHFRDVLDEIFGPLP